VHRAAPACWAAAGCAATVGRVNPIRLRGPADVVAALPYQFGYHLQDCLVVIALHSGSVGMLQRLDLPRPRDAGEAAGHLVEPLRRERAQAVLLVAYERDPGAAMPVLDAAAERIAGAGIEVRERVVVRDGRWYAPDCHKPCCPEDGLPLPSASDTPAIADFVGLEMAPLPSRESLTSLVAADEAVCREVAAALAGPAPSRSGRAGSGRSRGLRPAGGDRAGGNGAGGEPAATDQHRAAVERLARLWLWAKACDVSEAARPVEELSADDVAELVRSLRDRELRDGVVARLCPRTLPMDKLDADLADAVCSTIPEPAWGAHGMGGRQAVLAARRLLARLQWLARAVPDEHCAGVLTVLASVSWWLGEGSLARVAVERALEHAPGYQLALLLEQLLDLGVRPGGEGLRRALTA